MRIPVVSRRTAIAMGAGAVFAPILSPDSALAKRATPHANVAVFDSHIQPISGDIKRYPYHPLRGSLPADAPTEPITSEMLVGWMSDNNVAGIALSQRTQLYGYDDSYVLDVSSINRGRMVSLPSLDAQASGAAELVMTWMKTRGAAGIRLVPTDAKSNVDWLASDRTQAMWEAVNVAGGCVSVLLRTGYRLSQEARDTGLKDIMRMAAKFPSITIVIDHLAHVPFAVPDYGIDSILLDLKAHDNVMFKFTTNNFDLLKKANLDNAPFVSHWVATFGAHRMMWGSEAKGGPTAAATYTSLIKTGRDSVSQLNAADQRALLYGNAERVFGPLMKRT